MDDVSVSGTHATQLAGLQQGLGPDLLHLHAQTLLTIPFRDRLVFAEAGRPRSLALARERGGQWPVGRGVRRQDDGVGHRPGAVWDVDAGVAVVFVVVGAERAARWDVGNGEGMGESGHILVPVLLKGPAADAVAAQGRVVLAALGALPGILGRAEEERHQQLQKRNLTHNREKTNGRGPAWRSLRRCRRSDTASLRQAPPASSSTWKTIITGRSEQLLFQY